eukprot:gene27280-47218_t
MHVNQPDTNSNALLWDRAADPAPAAATAPRRPMRHRGALGGAGGAQCGAALHSMS